MSVVLKAKELAISILVPGSIVANPVTVTPVLKLLQDRELIVISPERTKQELTGTNRNCVVNHNTPLQGLRRNSKPQQSTQFIIDRELTVTTDFRTTECHSIHYYCCSRPYHIQHKLTDPIEYSGSTMLLTVSLQAKPLLTQKWLNAFPLHHMRNSLRLKPVHSQSVQSAVWNKQFPQLPEDCQFQ